MPGYHVAYHDKARILIKLNQFDEAIDCYDKIV